MTSMDPDQRPAGDFYDPDLLRRVVIQAHQALIDHWPRLGGWLDEDREFLRWRAEVEDDVARWRSSGEDDGTDSGER